MTSGVGSFMMKANCFIVILLLILPASLRAQRILTGAEQMEIYLPLLAGKRAGVVANATSVVGERRVNIVDTMLSSGVRVVRIFSPEHGFRNFADAGRNIADSVDPVTGLPVVSLYGKKKKPSPADLQGMDIMVFDLQDVGVRFFTYISTLTYVMEACANNNIPLILLDRPNPNGCYIDGPVLEPKFASFVGLHPVPVVYGMTIGEYAGMVNREKWLKSYRPCRLTVIPAANYSHNSPYVLPVKPSPNLPDMNAVLLYPSLCFFEGTIVSVGRGTRFPFETFGHPELKGYSFTFTPESIPGMSGHPPFEGVLCHGTDLRNYYHESKSKPDRINLSWLLAAFDSMGGKPAFFNDYFDKLAGTASLRKMIQEGKNESQVRRSWQPGLEKFKKIRKKYLLYPE